MDSQSIRELLDQHASIYDGSPVEKAMVRAVERANDHRTKVGLAGLVALGGMTTMPRDAGAAVAPPPGWHAYVVQPGDTLVGLSGHSLAVEGQIMANPLNRQALPYTNQPDLLVAGATMVIPNQQANTATTAVVQVAAPLATPTAPTVPTPTAPAPAAAGQTTAGAAVLQPGVIVKDNPNTDYTPWTVNSSVVSTSGFSADQLNQILALTGAGPQMAGLGPAFAALEQGTEGPPINALFAMAHAEVESANGTSYIAQHMRNLFGMNATDSNPDGAWVYPSAAANVAAYLHFLTSQYLMPGGASYVNATDSVADIFVHYSTAGQAEANTVVAKINQYIAVAQAHGIVPAAWPGNPVPQSPQTPPSAPVVAPTISTPPPDTSNLVLHKDPGQ